MINYDGDCDYEFIKKLITIIITNNDNEQGKNKVKAWEKLPDDAKENNDRG